MNDFKFSYAGKEIKVSFRNHAIQFNGSWNGTEIKTSRELEDMLISELNTNFDCQIALDYKKPSKKQQTLWTNHNISVEEKSGLTVFRINPTSKDDNLFFATIFNLIESKLGKDMAFTDAESQKIYEADKRELLKNAACQSVQEVIAKMRTASDADRDVIRKALDTLATDYKNKGRRFFVFGQSNERDTVVTELNAAISDIFKQDLTTKQLYLGVTDALTKAVAKTHQSHTNSYGPAALNLTSSRLETALNNYIKTIIATGVVTKEEVAKLQETSKASVSKPARK